MTIARTVCILVLLAAFATTSLMAQTAAKPGASTKAPAGPSAVTTLEKLERDGWEAFKNKDDKAYTALCAPGYTGVFADGQAPHDLKSALAAMHGVTVHHYTLSDLKVNVIDGRTALVTYRAAVNLSTGNGQPQDFKLAVTDLWINHAGQWKALRYHESEVK